MQRVLGFYLYEVGFKIHPLAELKGGRTTYQSAFLPAYIAKGALEPFVYNSVFRLQTCVPAAHALLSEIDFLLESIRGTSDREQLIDDFHLFGLRERLSEFEAVLAAEFGMLPLYIVQKKGGLDLGDLIENGSVVFPAALSQKVPEAVYDLSQGGRCLAFELYTAAGFHLHRANESVLKAYFGAVAGDISPPRTRNMGGYISELEKAGRGDPAVLAALKSLKDLHRNPLIHPEHTITDVEEAISLLSQIRAAIGYMLQAIPLPVDATESNPVGQV